MNIPRSDAEILNDADTRFRCSEEKDRGVLLSNPPQYRCERCSNTWIVGARPPFCQKANLSDFLTALLSQVRTSERERMYKFIERETAEAGLDEAWYGAFFAMKRHLEAVNNSN